MVEGTLETGLDLYVGQGGVEEGVLDVRGDVGEGGFEGGHCER